MTVAILEMWLGAATDDSGASDGRANLGRSSRSKGDAAPDDRILIERIREGNGLAFDALALRHIPALVRFAGAIVADRDTAEDVVQVVLARLWEGRASILVRGSVVAYLCAMVRNQALDVRRREGARSRASMAAALEIGNALPTPEIPEESDQVRRLREAFFTLPEHYRAALQLRYGQRLGYADLGEALGLSVKGAERLLARSVAALRRSLGVDE